MLALASLGISAAQAAVTWSGADLADFATGSNWVGGAAPTNTDDIIIDNGTRADYTGSAGDFASNSTLTITGAGSGYFTNEGNWTRLNGTTTVTAGTIDVAGTLVFGSDNIVTGSTINLNLSGGSAQTGNELWFGWASAEVNHTINVNISNGGSLTSTGGGGASIWLWDDVTINFTGSGTIEAAGPGLKNGAGLVSWEDLWTAGDLQFNGANAGSFSDHFSTTGTNGTDTYTLTAVPEPSSTALLGLGGLALILRRRK